MAKFNNFKRIVVYCPRNGWVCDLGPGKCLDPQFTPDENYFDTAAGTRRVISRNRSFLIQVFDETSINHLRIMWKEGCDVRAIAIGDESNVVWELDSAFNLVEFRQGVGGLSGATLRFHNDLYHGSVYQAKDLLSGIPWEAETATTIGGVIYFPGPAGWSGNRWIVGSDNVADETGALTGTGQPILTMYLPFEGATFNLSGTFTGNLTTLDFSGSNLTVYAKVVAGTDTTNTLDAGTWQVEVNVTAATTRPELYITAPGAQVAPRTGGAIDCSDPDATLSTAPSWTS